MSIPSRVGIAPEIVKLRGTAAVRERCAMVYRWVAEGRSPHFELDVERLEAVAQYVAEVTREAYPDLAIPYHSRWRHFSAGGIDRWNELSRRVAVHPIERARMAVDLVTVSVLLDAGAGDAWRYREGAISFARSEGLAVASFDMFRAGAFSSDRNRPYRVDDAALARIDAPILARHFQVGKETRSSEWKAAAPCCGRWASPCRNAAICSDARRRAPAISSIILQAPQMIIALRPRACSGRCSTRSR
jgi:hypothetical protein